MNFGHSWQSVDLFWGFVWMISIDIGRLPEHHVSQCWQEQIFRMISSKQPLNAWCIWNDVSVGILCVENLGPKVHAPSEHTLRQASWAMEVQFWHVRISEIPPSRASRYEMNLNPLKFNWRPLKSCHLA